LALRQGGDLLHHGIVDRSSWFGSRWMASRAGTLLPLGLTVCGLVGGGLLHWAGMGAGGNLVWILAASCGIALSFFSMVESLIQGRLGVDVIALLALVGAVAVGEYLAGAVISVMLASGRALEGWAAGQARRELEALLERAPKSARRYQDGGLVIVALDQVVPGDLLLVAPGEVVPVDGSLVSASAELDESALSGEPLPVEHPQGDRIRSGVVNAGAQMDLRATTCAAESTYAAVVRLVAEAEHSQAPVVRLADRFALGFLAVTLAAAAIAWAAGGAGRAVAVLVVATPCPLILAAPVALVSGLSRAAKRGVIVKGGAVLERLATCTTLLIDKTGTMTVGHPMLTEVVCAGSEPARQILQLAASLDQVSPHVLASAVVRSALEQKCELALPSGVEEIAGQGIRGTVAGHQVAVGKASWSGVTGTPPWARSIRRRVHLDGALTVFVGIDGSPAGVLVFDDPLRPDAARTLRSLRRSGIARIVMVTGDRAEVAETVGAVIGVDEVLAERSPAEKLDVVRLETHRAPTMMVGDGINDAPALALADVGVALGARGATAASEAADAVLTVDRLDRLGEAAAIARRTRRIAVESMVAGMALSLVAMGVAAAGLLPAVWGAILQEVIDVAVILNALRALGGGATEVRLGEEDSLLTQRFREEHLAIRSDINRLHQVADALGSLDPETALAQVRSVYRTLVDEVQPHEEAEEQELYPALGRFFGGNDPMATMSRAHLEITHQIRRLGQLIDDVGPEGIDDIDLTELRSLLYGLHAILKLHTAQEDENYLSLADEPRYERPATEGAVKA
jgi:heavy metal translocating P-type ATPase